MKRRFRLDIGLEVDVRETPADEEKAGRGIHGSVGCLTGIAARDVALRKEIVQLCFFQLIDGGYYGDAILRLLKPREDEVLILDILDRLPEKDALYLRKFFTEPLKPGYARKKDDILNLFYSAFGNPEITAISLSEIE